MEDCASSQDCPHDGDVVSVALNESKNLHSHDITDVATSPETDKDCLQVDPTIHGEGGLAPSRKRIGYQNDV